MNRKKLSDMRFAIISIILILVFIASVIGLTTIIVEEISQENKIKKTDNFEIIEKQNTTAGTIYIAQDKNTDLLFYIIEKPKGVAITPIIDKNGQPVNPDEYLKN